MRDTEAFQKQVGRIEELVQNIESAADPAMQATAKELVRSVMDLHGAAIERILEIVTRTGEQGKGIVRSLGTDELVGSLLVLYDLHPEDFATRARRGIENARQILTRRAASVDVIAIGDDTVHLKIDSNGHSCGSTIAELQSIVRDVLFEVAPDAAEIIVDSTASESASGFVPLDSLQVGIGSGPTRVLSRP
ncbi:MAG: hypothetical protein ACJ74Z_09110 [Bryobacteraceae bacterium]